MLLYGIKDNFTQLIEIWQEAFGDSEDLITAFLNETVRPDEIYVWVEEGVTAGVLYALPCTIRGKKGFYWYALATRKEYRCRGIMRKLMEKAARDAEAAGSSFIWLVPADEGLFRYYTQYGFTYRIPRRETGEVNIRFPRRVMDYIRLEMEEDEKAAERGEKEMGSEKLPTDGLFRWFGDALITELHGKFPY